MKYKDLIESTEEFIINYRYALYFFSLIYMTITYMISGFNLLIIMSSLEGHLIGLYAIYEVDF